MQQADCSSEFIGLSLTAKHILKAVPMCHRLFQGGQDRILKKVVEEAGEVLLGSKNGQREEVIYEVADLLFHTLVVLGHHDITLHEIYQELASRHGKPGLRWSGKAKTR